jgi:hypothetical protein
MVGFFMGILSTTNKLPRRKRRCINNKGIELGNYTRPKGRGTNPIAIRNIEFHAIRQKWGVQEDRVEQDTSQS